MLGKHSKIFENFVRAPDVAATVMFKLCVEQLQLMHVIKVYIFSTHFSLSTLTNNYLKTF